MIINFKEVLIMFCKYCGNALADNSNFCSACGNQVEAAAPAAVPVAEAVQPAVPVQAQVISSANDKELADRQSSVLTYGILGLALATAAVFANFLGIIFGAIAQRKAKEYVDLTGESPARVSVGRGLGKAGVIAGIAMTGFWTLYFGIIIIAAIAQGY